MMDEGFGEHGEICQVLSQLIFHHNTQFLINLIYLSTDLIEVIAEASGLIISFDKQFIVITYCCELMKLPPAPARPPAVRFHLFSFKHQPSPKKTSELITDCSFQGRSQKRRP